MSNDYDPRLQSLFAKAQEALDRDAFTRAIVERIDRQRRRAMLAWSVFALVGVMVLALLAHPVFTALAMATELLPVSLVDIETGWLRQLLSPINSVAAATALGALGIHRLVRRLLG